MAYQNQGGGYGGGYGGRSQSGGVGGNLAAYFEGAPVTKWLVIVNLVVFVLTLLGRGDGYENSMLEVWGMFNVERGLLGFELWRIVTFQFLHADFGHLFGNMLGIFFFGRLLERWWGSGAYLGYYLLCGVAGALFLTLLIYVPWLLPEDVVGTYLLGASAGVFGVLIGVAILNPEGIVYLFFVLPMKMRTFAIGFLCYEVFIILTNGQNAGGSAGHLGGVILGVILVKKHRWFRGFFEKKKPMQPQVPKRKIFKPKLKPRVQRAMDLDVGDEEVNAILEKISAEGIHSLNETEKAVLEERAKRSKN